MTHIFLLLLRTKQTMGTTHRKRRLRRLLSKCVNLNLLLVLLLCCHLLPKCHGQAPGPLPFNDAVQDAIEAARQEDGQSLARARQTAQLTIVQVRGVIHGHRIGFKGIL